MVPEQVQRLVAVLSVPAVTRGALLTDGAPDLATGLPPADAAVLRAAGWTPENGLRSLLNFSGAHLSGWTESAVGCKGKWEVLMLLAMQQPRLSCCFQQDGTPGSFLAHCFA